jgi:hypothetical protein
VQALAWSERDYLVRAYRDSAPDRPRSMTRRQRDQHRVIGDYHECAARLFFFAGGQTDLI